MQSRKNFHTLTFPITKFGPISVHSTIKECNGNILLPFSSVLYFVVQNNLID